MKTVSRRGEETAGCRARGRPWSWNEAAFWYEEQRVGLGQGFLGAAEAVFDQICTYPKSGTSVPYLPEELPAQRVPLQRFPYQVVYLETEAAIHILAVAHDRRRPGYWVPRFPE